MNELYGFERSGYIFGENGCDFDVKIIFCRDICLEISVFDFHVGHDKPESQGGTLDINNLKPICARCNLSMSDNFTIKQWNNLSGKTNTCCVIC